MTGKWEDCPCCGEATFPDGSRQWDGEPVPCGCVCWVSIDEDEDEDGEAVGSISMGDGPCPVCSVRTPDPARLLDGLADEVNAD